MLDRRNFPHRIYGEIFMILDFGIADDLRIVGMSNLLQHPARDPSA